MERIDPELRRVLDLGLQQAVPGPHTEARVLDAILARLPRGGPGGDGGPDGGPDGGGEPSPDTWIPDGTIAVGSEGAKTIVATAIVSVLAVGAAAVATNPAAPPVAPATLVPEPEQRQPVPEPNRAVTKSPPANSKQAPAVAPVEPERSRRAVVPEPKRALESKAVAQPNDMLAAETKLIAAAEAALANGQPDRALAFVGEHAKRHPKGQLRTEREAIEASALCAKDDPVAAAAAKDFLRRHADSPAAAKVRAQCKDAKNRASR